jgi:TolB-like protein/DNA-binding winged helix-turn-helix (wHTH) protein
MSTPASTPAPPVYRFADLTLDAGQRRVLRRGQTIELSALNFDLLRQLVESAPNVVSSDVLAEKVWGRHFVSPENVAQRIMLLRQSLADDAGQPRYVETIRNKGYRLVPSVQTLSREESPSAPRSRKLLWAAAGLFATLGLAFGVYWRDAVPSGPTDAVRAYAPRPSSVAVLPFDNLSPDPGDAFFAVGLHEAILSQLANVREMHVVARASVQGYAGTRKPTSVVARELNVETVLDGSVRYADGQVLVTMHLSDGATNTSLWSDSYEHDFSKIFTIQTDIALKVAKALKAELLPAERGRVVRAPTPSLPAYTLYLQAVARARRATPEEILLAIKDVEQALELDRDFAAAWVLAANLRTGAGFRDPERAVEHRARGEHAARRALELDPDLGTAHVALGFALAMRKDWTGAEAAYREAVRRNVPLGEMSAYAMLTTSVANFAYAREILEEELRLNPQNRTVRWGLMGTNALLGDWDVARAQYDAGTRLFAPWPEGDEVMMHLEVGRKELERARAIPAAGPINPTMIANLDDPQTALRELHQLYADPVVAEPALNHRDIALWAGHFGDAALALDAVSSLVAKHTAQAVYLWLPQFKEIRQLPEFKALLRDIGIVAHWEEYGWPATCRRLDRDDFECD